jgi:hypothetical protein
VRQRTALRPVGTLGATATYAGVRTPTLSEPGDKPERRGGYPSRYGNSSWRRSTRASRSVHQDDVEWSAELEAALTVTRHDDLEHGTNAAYVAGCVCRECREHQRVRMARSRG